MKSLAWRPFTQHKTAAKPLFITHGKGALLFDKNNDSFLDLISSWWVNIHGHAHPKICQAIYEQSQTLEQVVFADCCHSPALDLLKTLQTKLPSSLSHFFFSDNGSTSVEVALKMAYQYWINRKEKKNLFVAFEKGYHGDTVGAMSVGDRNTYFSAFQDLLFPTHFLPFPETWHDDPLAKQKETVSLNKAEDFFKKNHHNIAAIILEPLIQGAGGMRMSSISFLQQLLQLTKKYKILTIFDEIMTGFGRTGSLFSYLKSNTVPDIICLSKGLTGGFLPLALTVATEEIFSHFLSDDPKKTFLHGHSYTANPIACAAANASLKIFEEENTLSKIQEIEAIHTKRMQELTQQPNVTQPRIMGSIAAFNMQTEQNDYFSSIGPWLKKQFFENKLYLRPLGNTVYLMPPYVITKTQLNSAYDKILEIIEKAHKTFRIY